MPYYDYRYEADLDSPIIKCDGTGNRYHIMPKYPCPHCQLVTYCCPECRNEMWEFHKPDCIPEVIKDAIPKPGDDLHAQELRFWAPYPATDLLNLPENEGSNFDGKLRILIAGEFTARHLVQTIASIPWTAKPNLEVVLSDGDTHHLVRTIAVLLMLLPREGEAEVGVNDREWVNAAVHLCYSARLLPKYARMVEERVFSTLADKCKEALAMAEEKHSNQIATVVAWPMLNGHLELKLLPSSYKKILAHTSLSNDRSNELFNNTFDYIRGVDIQRTTYPMSKVYQRMTPGRAMSVKKWRRDGLLLPYRHSGSTWTVKNCILYPDTGSSYPVGIVSEPLIEWGMEIYEHSSYVENDAYAKMFQKVRGVFLDFRTRAQRHSVALSIQVVDCSTGVEFLEKDSISDGFDRIELGTSFDFGEEGPRDSLARLARCLKSIHNNPYATGMALTRHSVSTTVKATEKDMAKEMALNYVSAGTYLDDLAPPTPHVELERMIDEDPRKAVVHRGIWRRQMGLELWRNYEKFSDHYLNSHPNCVIEDSDGKKEGIIRSRYMGMVFQDKNHVTKRWPGRLIHNKADKPSKLLFDRAVGWPDVNPARWLEWKREDTVPDSIYLDWLQKRAAHHYFESQGIDIGGLIIDDKEQGKAKEKFGLSEPAHEPDLSWIDEIDQSMIGGANTKKGKKGTEADNEGAAGQSKKAKKKKGKGKK